MLDASLVRSYSLLFEAGMCGDFDIVLDGFSRDVVLSVMTPHARRLQCTSWRPYLLDADRCVQSNVMTDLRLQVRPARRVTVRRARH